MSEAQELRTYWGTKQVFTKGIEEVQGYLYEGMLVVEKGDGRYKRYFGKREFHTTLEAARVDAERRRQNKLKTLRKQIRKIEDLIF